MASKVSICNMALALVGHSQTIASVDEAGTPAQWCRLLWDHVRDGLLETLDWPFARRREALAEIDRGDDQPDEWAYCYAWPSEALIVREIVDGLRTRRTDARIEWQVEGDGTQRVIYTDQANAVARYTALVSDVSHWPPSFAEALAWQLAIRLAGPLRASPAIKKELKEGADRVLAEALLSSQQLGVPAPEPTPEFIAERE